VSIIVYYKLHLENANYYSVHNPVSCCLLSKNTEIKIYRTINVISVCETWSLKIQKEHRLMAFEDRLLRKSSWI